MAEVPKGPELGKSRNAENVGEERGKVAAEWLGKRWGGVKGIATRGGSFLKRLGLAALAPDVAVANVGAKVGEVGVNTGRAVAEAGRAVGEAGRDAVDRGVGAGKEGYRYVSKQTENAAGVFGRELLGAWVATAEITGGIYDRGRERVVGICEKGRQYRASLIEKINDAQIKSHIRELEQKRSRLLTENAKNETIINKSEMTVTLVTAKIGDNNEGVTAIDDILAKLTGQTGASNA